MAELLLKTGSRQLVEGNTWKDDYWCARHCLQFTHPAVDARFALLPSQAYLVLAMCVCRGITLEGKGNNMLGVLLMEQRSMLAGE